MWGRWGENPLAAVAVSMALGISCSWFISLYSFAALSTAALLLICGAVLTLRRNRLGFSLALGISAIGLCGMLLSLARRDGHGLSDLRSLLSHSAFRLDESLAFDGCVVEESHRRAEEMVATVELRAIRKNELWFPCEGAGTLRMPAPATGDESLAQLKLQYGDRVRGWATWHVPHNYQNPGSSDHIANLQRRGIYVIGKAKSPRLLEIVPQDCAPPLGRAAVWVRNSLRDSLQALVLNGREKEAAILASVVLGDYSDLDNQTREVFQNTGTYHVLVVSGLHVAWMAWLFIRLFHLLRMPKGVGRILSAIGIFFYTFVIGFQASISRCLWMFILYLIGQALFRRASPTNILFASALILLVARPDWLLDAGFQLSFLSVLAICQMALPFSEGKLRPALDPARHAGEEGRLFVQPGRWHLMGRRLKCRSELLVEACEDRWNATLARCLLVLLRGGAGVMFLLGETIVVSVSVQIWLEMVLAWHFNRLSWISPFSNIVAVPVSSLVLASGMIAGLAANVPLLARPALESAGFLASFLLRSNQWMSEIPAAWQRCPTPPSGWVLATLAAVSAWCFLGWRRLWIPCLLVAASLAILSVGWNPVPAFRENDWQHQSSCLRMTFLDVGEGDSIVIRFPAGQVWIVDAGGIRQAPSSDESASAFDIGEAVVSRYLWSEWITALDRLIISHPDVDHAGGAQTLLKNFRTGVLEYGEPSADTLLSRILNVAERMHVPNNLVCAGRTEFVGGVGVQVLNPPAANVGRSTNENSIVLQLEFGAFTALLTGDLEKSSEAELIAGSKNLRSILLKVAHHGSRSATLGPFLERVSPQWAIISVGRNNPFGHPSREVLLRLLRHGVRPLLTLDQGAITFVTDGRQYLIESHVGGLLERGTFLNGSRSD